jgi:hypothetical protein
LLRLIRAPLETQTDWEQFDSFDQVRKAGPLEFHQTKCARSQRPFQSQLTGRVLGARRPVDRRRRLLVGLALPTPFAASLPYVAASALVHVVYFLLVGRLYRNADLSPIR